MKWNRWFWEHVPYWTIKYRHVIIVIKTVNNRPVKKTLSLYLALTTCSAFPEHPPTYQLSLCTQYTLKHQIAVLSFENNREQLKSKFVNASLIAKRAVPTETDSETYARREDKNSWLWRFYSVFLVTHSARRKWS